MAADGVKSKLPFHFIIVVVAWLQHPTGPQSIANRGKNGILKRHSFSEEYILEKENTHIPSQLLDSSSLDWDCIPEQGKVLDTVQLLDITTRVLFPN